MTNARDLGGWTVEHEPCGLAGRSCVTLRFTYHLAADLEFRLTLQDAETVAEAIMICVREAEEMSGRK